MAAGALCPQVALRLGVALLCLLLQVWDQVAVGATTLTEWLLGDDSLDANSEEDTDVDEEFLFEKGDLNLWAEPLQWARLLHVHLAALPAGPDPAGIPPAERCRLAELAQKQAQAVERALRVLPTLPQFSATLEHTRLSIQKERATLALSVLGLE